MNGRMAVLVALLACLLPAASFAQERFPTPDAAAEALVQAVQPAQPDEARLATLFGQAWRTFVPVGSVEREDVDAFLGMYRTSHAFRDSEGGRKLLAVGNDGFTFAVPLARDDRGWYFDVQAGEQELRTRRIGRNELDAVEALRAYHDAQNDYAVVDRDGDGALEYAQKMVSTDGRHDGLYWADDDSNEVSPLGPLFGDETPQQVWHGYRYRILTGQGASAPGGAFDYRVGENMMRGFAAVAWPAEYGESGVKTFLISHDGLVFERDLGPDSEQAAKAMERFDPDSAWSEVKEPASP